MRNINNSNMKSRKTIRMKEYNYSNNGIYFITICTSNRKEILSKIKNVGARGTVPTNANSINENRKNSNR